MSDPPSSWGRTVQCAPLTPEVIVVLEFPTIEAARTWYALPAYQELAPLRTRNIPGDLVLVDGVAPDYDPRATAAALRAGSVV
ncbi:DUF1330 domain-containing protein [Streptomyces sp. DT9]